MRENLLEKENLPEKMTDAVESGVSVLTSTGAATARSRRPVFVMGCHRSGTNLLYDTLMSAGGFALYNGYLPVHKTLIPRFGHPRNPANRRKLVDAFMRSKGFVRTGLDASDLRIKLLAEAETGGDFLRIIMEEIARRQNAGRWAVYDPDNVLLVPTIKADIPDALFVHIIRDGRDIALSLSKMGGFRPFPWSRRPRGLLETALYWEWMVQAGQRHGRQIPADYIEIHYEELVTQPQRALATLGQFLDHDLDYVRIQQASVGSLRESNSSFLDEGASDQHPVNRWRERLSNEEIASIEALISRTLEESGYQLNTAPEQRRLLLRWKCAAAAYPLFLDTKFWLKLHTPVGRLSNLAALELAAPPDHAS